MTILMIDEDKQNVMRLTHHLKEVGLKAKIIYRKDMGEFNKNNAVFDLGYLDLTAVMGGISLVGCWDSTIMIIRYFMEHNPNAKYILYSAVRIWAEDAIEEIKNDLPDFDITLCAQNWWETIIEKVKEAGK